MPRCCNLGQLLVFASSGPYTMSCLKCLMKLDRLDRVPFLRPGLLEALWTSHIHIPRRSPFNFISIIMPHGMSTCNNPNTCRSSDPQQSYTRRASFSLKLNTGEGPTCHSLEKASVPVLFVHFSAFPSHCLGTEK